MPKLYRITAYIYFAYLFLAIVIISPALTLLPERLAGDYVDRPLTLDWAWFNPFTLSLEVRGLELTEKNGEPFTGFSAASVNLSLASLVTRGVVLDALLLENFHLHVLQTGPDTFNFSDLIPPATESEPEEEAGATIPAITIGEVALHASALTFSDTTRETPLNSEWRDLRIDATDLSTVIEDGQPYNIALTAPAGGSLNWRGDVSLPHSASHGRLEIKGLELHALWQFAEPWLNFRLADGSLDFEVSYALDWSEEFAFNVSDGALTLADIDIQPKDSAALPDTSVAMATFSAAGIGADSAEALVTVGQIDTGGLAIHGFNTAEEVSLQALFTPDLAGSATDPADAGDSAADDPAQTEGTAWEVQLGGFALSAGSVHWRSPFTEPATTAISPINITIGPVSWPAQGDTPLSLDLAINALATLQVTGNIDIDAGNGHFDYSLNDLQLPWFNPALPPQMTAKLGSGALAINGSATLDELSPGTVALNASVTDVALVRATGEHEFGGFKALQLDQLAVDLPAREVTLDRLLLDAFNGRLHIESDGTINTSHLMAPAPEDEHDAAQEAATESAPEEAEPDAVASAPWQVAVKEIAVRDTRVDFADESLSSEFRTDIESLDGEILGLDSSAATPARVNLEGSVEGYAPVSLTGTANPLADPPSLDLELEFDGLDMARFTPYSGTYAGYKIDRGLLNIKLDYELADSKLKGRNQIVVSQLKLGDSVDSDRALDLPLKAALSLLTDANGVIDLAVPVAGNLDDPKFKLGSVIATAFKQVIIKAVTAPFSLLARLVGSDDDFQHIVFSSGSAELDEHNREKLTELATALTQRPRLSLALAGQVNRDTDRKALQQAALNRELLEQGLSSADIEARNPAWEAAIATRYQRLEEQQEELAAAEQHRAVLSALPVPEEQLAALAAARASAVEAHLVATAGLPAERVTIDPSRLKEDVQPISGVQLFIGN